MVHDASGRIFDFDAEARARIAEMRVNAWERQAKNLLNALGTSRTIGQAQGILMERHGCNSDEAFLLLVRISQRSNIKVHVIAAAIVEAGDLPWVDR